MIDPSAINTSFSRQLPGMQLAVDSTSMGEFKTCPRKYYYNIILGLQPKATSPHLAFGTWLHQAREGYEHAIASGLSHDDALDKVLDFLLKATWNPELGRPWISDHPQKNRKSLIQTAIWYLDAKAKDDPLKTVIRSDGRPAVELSFRFDSGIRTSGGEAIIACGHLDRLATLNGVAYIPDIKTSTSDVNAKWLAQFTPGNQFSLYTIAGKVAFGMEVEGVMVDGVQVGAGFARFQRYMVPRTEEQLQEYLRDFAINIEQMEQCATRQYWPMNDKVCDMYGGCAFRELCKRTPGVREKLIPQFYSTRVWDPLQIRGDI